MTQMEGNVKTGRLWPILALVMVITIVASSGCAMQTAAPTATPTTGPKQAAATATPTPKPVTIKFWEWFGGAFGDFWEAEAKLFHAQYPWITVEVSHYPDQTAFREALALAFQSNGAPDTFLRRHTFREVYDNKWAMPLDQWITPQWLAKFPSGSFAETKNVWDGKIYSFPIAASKLERMLYLNETMFREAGLVDQSGGIKVPQTWGELRAMARQITTSGKGKYYGLGLGIKDARQVAWWFELADLAGASGTYEIDYRTGRYTFGTDPAYAAIVDLLLAMKSDGSIYPTEGSMDDSNSYTFFGQRKFAILLSGSWTTSNLKRDFPDFQDYRIVPLPAPDSGRKGGLPIAPGSGQVYISTQTKNPNESWLWLDWISSRDFHSRMVSLGLEFSIYGDLNSQQNIADAKRRQAYEAATKNLVVIPFPPARNPQTALVSPKSVVPDIGDVLVGIYTGQIKDWQSALKALDERKQAALDAAIKKAQNDGANVSIDDFVFPDWDTMKDYVTKPAK